MKKKNVIFTFYFFVLINFDLVLIRIEKKTFIETKFKKSDDSTDIGKYKVAVNITEYQLKTS